MQSIVVTNEYFNLEDTLTCGQVFRYKKLSQGYEVISLNKICYAYEENGVVHLQSDDIDYFYNYFDLATDYKKLNNDIVKLAPSLHSMAELGKGIRLLKQNSFEMIISFIISANNNIPRITKIINGIAELAGTQYDWGYAFPTYEQLCKLGEADYKSIGAGYRANYLYETVAKLNEEVLLNLKNLQTQQLLKELCKLKGVGTKVADCIMLFGLSRGDTFPVDTWMEQALLSDELTSNEKIRTHYISRLGGLAGLAQQYIFHYKRNLERKMNSLL